MKIGYKLIAEGFCPQELVRQAVRAEQSDGFFDLFESDLRPRLLDESTR